MKTNMHFDHLVQALTEWATFLRQIVEKIKTHFVFSNFFFRKSYRLWDNVEKIL